MANLQMNVPLFAHGQNRDPSFKAAPNEPPSMARASLQGFGDLGEALLKGADVKLTLVPEAELAVEKSKSMAK